MEEVSLSGYQEVEHLENKEIVHPQSEVNGEMEIDLLDVGEQNDEESKVQAYKVDINVVPEDMSKDEQR